MSGKLPTCREIKRHFAKSICLAAGSSERVKITSKEDDLSLPATKSDTATLSNQNNAIL